MRSFATAAIAAVVACLAVAPLRSLPYPYHAGLPLLDIPNSTLARLTPGSFEPPFALNGRLQAATRLFEGQVSGSESVAVTPAGDLIMLDKYGFVHRAVREPSSGEYTLRADAPTTYIGPGRPLGYHVVEDGAALLVCDSLKGLVRVELATGAVTILSNWVGRAGGAGGGAPVHYANDLDVARDGVVYFSSSTSMPVTLNARLGFYDTMRAYTLNLLRGDASGRLLAYDPRTRATKVLASGLFYANGVSLSADGTFVAVVETNGCRVLRYWLAGPKAGTLDVLIEKLPAVPDGITASSDGNFWVALVTRHTDFLRACMRYRILRLLLSAAIPYAYPLLIHKFSGLIKVSPEGEVLDALFDPEGEYVNTLSAVTEHDGRLFLGNLFGNFVSVLKLG